MPYASLREFVAHLEKTGRLVRVKERVSTVLEMTEIQTRLLAEGGPAVIFENAVMADGRPSPMPVLVNLFGTVERVAWGMDKEPGALRQVGETLAFLRQPEPPRGIAQALELLHRQAPRKAECIGVLEREGYPCYTTSAGWLGYDDDKLRRLCREAVAGGFNHVKLKVGRSLQDDIRRVSIAREVLGPDRQLMIDANQAWEVGQAIGWVRELAFARPWFIEEPTSPDDVEGHRAVREAVAPVQVASGEMCQNRILFKQFIMRGAIDVVQIDACRLGGVNEVLLVLLLAAKYGLPVCPHAGGVGLCEYVQHLSMIDFVCVSGTREGRVIEYVDHLHEHFVDPCVVRNAAYMPPGAPGYSITMKPESLHRYRFPA